MLLNKKRTNPQISIISPVYNRENFLLRFLKSIYYQNYNNIEIILLDDHSIDNSVKFIEKYQKLDKRIILIKNKKNKGTFISRNLGVLYSKGKYLILPDPDDILSKNNLRTLFYFAKKYDYDLIRFNMYLKGKTITFKKIVDNLKDNPVYQPELLTYNFYGNNELERVDCYINNKFIKRVIYIEAMNSLNIIYANMYMTFMEDSIINYLIYRTSKSFYFFKKIGYYYIKSIHSITKNLFKISNLRIQFIFIYLKFIFENSKNNKYERDMSNELFTLLFKDFKLFEKLRSSCKNLNSSLFNQTINHLILLKSFNII
jgi:glycosyltransferase involved in cell wall biosynthesis